MQLDPKKLGISAVFDKKNAIYSIRDIVNGTIVIEPPVDIQYKLYSFQVIWSAIHKQSSKKKEVTILNKRWSNSGGVWKANERFEQNFKFRTATPVSFDGKYYLIQWKVVLEVELAGDSRSLYKKAANRYLKIDKMLFPTNIVTFPFPLEVHSRGLSFRIKPRKEHYSLSSDLVGHGVLAGVSLAGVIFNWQAFLNFGIPIFEIAGSGAIGFGLYNTFVGFGKFKELTIATSQTVPDTFTVSLDVGRNWSSIKALRFHYYAIEELDEGSDENTVIRSSFIHRYTSSIFPVSGKITQTNLPLPPKNKGFPPSFNLHPYSIDWKMEVTLITHNKKEKVFKFHFPLMF